MVKKVQKKKGGSLLTLQFIPYAEIESLSSSERIEKLLSIVKADKIVLLEGRLRSHEEAELIRSTMEQIDQKFKGIELSVIDPEEKKIKSITKIIRSSVLNLLLGNRKGFTIIGPANVVKEIKQDPDKIQLFTETGGKKR